MYQLPDAIIAALEGPAPVIHARVVVLAPDLVTVRAAYELTTRIVMSGTVTADWTRDVRRQAQLRLADRDGTLAPAIATDHFAEGSPIRVERGPEIDGAPAWIPLMTGLVTGCEIDRERGTIDLTSESPMSLLDQDVGEGVVIPEGTSVPDALHMLWDPVLRFAEWVIDPLAGERFVGSTIAVLPSDNRLQVGRRLALDGGVEAFDDRLGRLIVRVRRDPTTQTVARSMLTPVKLKRRVGRKPVNAQPVEATVGDDETIWVVEEIDDPGSPIHRSRIGLRMGPMVRSDTISDPATARAVARMWLSSRALSQDRLEGDEVARHIDLDEQDVVTRSDGATRAEGRFRIDRITYPVLDGVVSTTESQVRPLYLEDEG